MFPPSCVPLYYLKFAVAYLNNVKAVIASVGCCHCQYRWLILFNIRAYAGIGSVNTEADVEWIRVLACLWIGMVQ